MAKVTVSAYNYLPRDSQGGLLPIAPDVPLAKKSYGTTGTATALPATTRIIRVATDTAIHISRTSTTVTTDDDMQLPGVEFYEADAGQTPNWIPA